MARAAHQPRNASSTFTPRRVVAVVLAVLAIVFVLQNRAEVTLQFIGFQVTASLWFASTALLLVGVAIGVLLTSRRAASR